MTIQVGGKSVTFGYWRYLPADHATSTETYPVLIFMHGAGERGDNLDQVLVHGPPKLIKAGNQMCFTVNAAQSCMIVLSPQLPSTESWWSNEYVQAMIDVSKTLRGDPARVYLTGLSMGGGATWAFSSGKDYGTNPATSLANQLAAVVPIAGAGNPYWNDPCVISSAGLPVWAFHGSADGTVSPQTSRDFVSAINGVKTTVYNGSTPKDVQCAADPVKALLTEYPGVGHDSWTYTYDPTHAFNPFTGALDANGVNIYQWLLSHHR